jgi:hypothetical protein
VSDRTRLDVLYLTDLRFPGGSSSSLVEEVRAAVDAGYRVGVLQCGSSSLRADRTFHSGIRSLIDDGTLLLIRLGEPVTCGVAIVKHPTVMVESMGGRLPVRSRAVVAFVGQVPSDDDGTIYYEPSVVHHNITEMLGEAPVWHPVSPVVRSRLEGSGVPLAPADWVEVIDPVSWSVPRQGLIGELPVIGRHGRPSALKWPDDPDDLAAVYPLDGRAVVRVLGGTAGLEAVLDDVPQSWEVSEFGSVDPREFLAEVDFFVYFHHRDLVEAFGRTVIEALSAGCVAILPTHFRELFGEACLYAEPTEVGPMIRGLHADPAAFLEQSRRGIDEVSRRFSHQTHVDRLQELVGDPSAGGGRATPSDRVPRRLADQRPTVLVSCLGAGPARTAEAIRAVVAHRDHATGFDPVMLCDTPAPLVAGHLDEELRLDAGSRRFVGSKSGIVVEMIESRESFTGEGSWENHLLARLAEIGRIRRISAVTVSDLGHPDAWLVLQTAL